MLFIEIYGIILFSCLQLENTKSCLDKNMLSTTKCFDVNLNNMIFSLFYDLRIYGIEITYDI